MKPLLLILLLCAPAWAGNLDFIHGDSTECATEIEHGGWLRPSVVWFPADRVVLFNPRTDKLSFLDKTEIGFASDGAVRWRKP